MAQPSKTYPEFLVNLKLSIRLNSARCTIEMKTIAHREDAWLLSTYKFIKDKFFGFFFCQDSEFSQSCLESEIVKKLKY